MKKVILTAALATSLLAACSKNDEVETKVESQKQEKVQTTTALKKTGAGIEGSWSFCNDKTLTNETVVESCTLYDAFVWQFDNDAITVGKVLSPLVKQDCNTQCYNADLADIKVTNIATGYYTEQDNAILIDIIDSSDLINFPTCQVKWNVIDEVDEQHQQWQLENVNCTNAAIIKFSTWSKKVN